MASKDPKKDDFDSDIPHIRKEDRPDFSKQPPVKALPKGLQETLDKSEDTGYFDSLYDGSGPESTDTNYRYAAYASRFRTIALASSRYTRYIAYTSDIGESFRPVAHPNWVRFAYGVSWTYLIGDVSYEGYKAYLRNQRVLHPESKEPSNTGESGTIGLGMTQGSKAEQLKPGRVVPLEDYRTVMVQRAIFQGVASMGLPALTIHSIVRYSGQAMKNVKNVRVRTWGPIGLGLAAVPALPYLFDHPVETAVEWTFHKGFEMMGGPDAVGNRPVAGPKVRELRQAENKAGAVKEKEKEL